MGSSDWTKKAKITLTPIKHFLSKISLVVRGDQYNIFQKVFNPTAKTLVLDVGSTSDETLKDSNLFLRLYPYQHRLTTATIENSSILKKKYPKISVKKVIPGKPLPFKNHTFDIAVSWATIEHVGNSSQQKFFLRDLLRVAKNVFLTTPYRGCPYEPHTGLWFLHWLPLKWFRWYCLLIGQSFLAKESNLNPLFVKDVRSMLPKKINFEIKVYKLFGFLPSHLIMYTIPK